MKKELLILDLKREKADLISESLAFIEANVKKFTKNKRNINESLVLSEELLIAVINAREDDIGGELRVSVRHNMWDCLIKISAPGAELKSHYSAIGNDLTESGFRKMIFEAYSDKISTKSKDGYNSIRISVGVKSHKLAYESMFALILGISAQVICSHLFSRGRFDYICDRYIAPINDVLLNLLGTLLLPMVLLSMISVVVKVLNFGKEDKVAFLTVIGSLVSSFFAALIGVFAYSRLNPGTVEYQYMFEHYAVLGDAGTLDFPSVLFGLVPADIFSPFIEQNTFQVIFLGLIIGICIGTMGEKSARLLNAANLLYDLFQSMVELVEAAFPYGIFFISFNVMNNYGGAVLLKLLPLLLTIAVGFAMMVVLYMMVIAIYSHINPFKFLYTCFPVFRGILKSGAGSDILPVTMRFCRSRLRVPNKYVSFVLPFGSQYNLDGSCIYLAAVGLFLADFCGITFYGDNALVIALTIVVLSVGIPSMAGNNIVCLASLLAAAGVPMELVGMIVCIDPILSLGIAVLNTMSDITIMLTICSKDKQLDTSVFDKRRKKI